MNQHVTLYVFKKKRASFDQAYVKNFCPPSFDRFEYAPSTGASGGFIIA
jgi:hypothetical protein